MTRPRTGDVNSPADWDCLESRHNPVRGVEPGLHGPPGTLDDADDTCIVVCMRTTLNLDDALLAEASDYAGVKGKTALLHEGLRALIQREAAARLAALGGRDRRAAAPPRRKSPSRG